MSDSSTIKEKVNGKKLPRVLLIDPPDYVGGKTGNLQLPLGLVALTNYLMKRGVASDVKIVDLTLELMKRRVCEEGLTPLDC